MAQIGTIVQVALPKTIFPVVITKKAVTLSCFVMYMRAFLYMSHNFAAGFVIVPVSYVF